MSYFQDNSTATRPWSLKRQEHINAVEIKVIFIIFIIIATFLGNGFILRFLTKDKRRLYAATNLYIASQCMCDLATTVLVIPFGAVSLLQGGWTHGETFTFINGFLNMFLTLVTLNHLALISLDRYFSMVKMRIFIKKQKIAFRILIGCWVAAFVMSFPWLSLLSTNADVVYFPGFLTCAQIFSSQAGVWEKYFYLCICLLAIGIPFAVVLLSFYRMSIFIKRSRNQITVSRASKQSVNFHAKSAKTALIIIFTSLIQVFPSCTMMFLEGMQWRSFSDDAATAAKLLMWAHCALKPLVYVARKNETLFSNNKRVLRVKPYVVSLDTGMVHSYFNNEPQSKSTVHKSSIENQPIKGTYQFISTNRMSTIGKALRFDQIMTAVEID